MVPQGGKQCNDFLLIRGDGDGVGGGCGTPLSGESDAARSWHDHERRACIQLCPPHMPGDGTTSNACHGKCWAQVCRTRQDTRRDPPRRDPPPPAPYLAALCASPSLWRLGALRFVVVAAGWAAGRGALTGRKAGLGDMCARGSGGGIQSTEPAPSNKGAGRSLLSARLAGWRGAMGVKGE